MLIKGMYFNRKAAVFLFFVIFLVCGFNPLLCQKRVRVVAELANIRMEPNLNSDVLTSVSRGTLLPVFKIIDEWYEVLIRFNSSDDFHHGFIHSSMVDEVPAGGEPVPLPDRPVQEMKDLSTTRKLRVGFSFGGASLFDKNYGSSLKIGIEVIYMLTETFSAELSFQEYGVNVDQSEGGLSDGVLTIIPVQLGLRMKLPFESLYNPYIAGGLGYYFNYFSLDDETDVTQQEDVKHTLGFHLGGGVDYFLRERLLLNLDLKFYFGKTSGSYEYLRNSGNVADKGTIENINIHGLILSLGVRYIF